VTDVPALHLDLWVPGHPTTKGSLEPRAPKCHCCPKCKGYARMPQLRDSESSKRWRKIVAYAAEQHLKAGDPGREFTEETPWIPRTWDVRMWLIFSLAVPNVTDNGAGDSDKLERNVFDALQDAHVYGDDVQVVTCWTEKRRVVDAMGPGVRIQLWGSEPEIRLPVTPAEWERKFNQIWGGVPQFQNREGMADGGD